MKEIIGMMETMKTMKMPEYWDSISLTEYAQTIKGGIYFLFEGEIYV
jgi:hypothetical protein